MGDYLNCNNCISLILLIIPFTAWIFGALKRFKEAHVIAGIVRLFGGFNIIWIVDLVLTCLNGCQVKIWRLCCC